VLQYSNGAASLEHILHINSRGKPVCHGQILSSIYETILSLSTDVDVFVRERAFARFSRETLALSKVVGIADLVAWQCSNKSYIEITPSAVKKLLTGSGKAGKEEVAAA